jgi:hypothetical protein
MSFMCFLSIFGINILYENVFQNPENFTDSSQSYSRAIYFRYTFPYLMIFFLKGDIFVKYFVK